MYFTAFLPRGEVYIERILYTWSSFWGWERYSIELYGDVSFGQWVFLFSLVISAGQMLINDQEVDTLVV